MKVDIIFLIVYNSTFNCITSNNKVMRIKTLISQSIIFLTILLIGII